MVASIPLRGECRQHRPRSGRSFDHTGNRAERESQNEIEVHTAGAKVSKNRTGGRNNPGRGLRASSPRQGRDALEGDERLVAEEDDQGEVGDGDGGALGAGHLVVLIFFLTEDRRVNLEE